MNFCFLIDWHSFRKSKRNTRRVVLIIKMAIHKILVVDDDPNILAAFQSFLEKEACEMIGVNQIVAVRKIIQTGEIDLFISDIRLGNTNSVRYLLEIKNQWPDLPLIVISGYPELISKEDLTKLKADYFFQKPLELTRIREAIRKLLRMNAVTNP